METENKCGECTLCCTVLEIKEVDSKANETCKHCILKKGCKIYDKRPQGCKEFKCMWLQMDNVHEDLRPDKCGVVFEKFTDKVIMGGTMGYMSSIVPGQIQAFNNEGISVVIVDHSQKKKFSFLANGHTREFVESEINGSS